MNVGGRGACREGGYQQDWMGGVNIMAAAEKKVKYSRTMFVLGACWGTEELGWNERSRKKLRDVRQQSNGFENYEL